MGIRFDDRVTGKVEEYAVNAKVINLEIDPAEINKIIYADAPVEGDAKETLPLLTAKIENRDHSVWLSELKECNQKEIDMVINPEINPTSGGIRMGEAASKISEAFNNEAILVTDVGQQQMMSARYFKYRKTRSVVTSGGLGTMGYGLPAAIGAKMGAPERDVCLVIGDGGMQMSIQELATIMQSEVDIKIVLFNNFFLGNVRQWQQMFFNHRYSFTELDNPDFSLIAQANKIGYACVDKREDLDEAIAQMRTSKGAFLLEVRVEREENVMPMVPPGAAVKDMILEWSEKE